MISFVAWFFVFYLWHLLGVTVGYHRFLAHRSFRWPKLVEYFFVLGGYLGFESSPIWWASVHRAHHRYVDTPLDPHSPRFGSYRAYMGWIFASKYPEHINPQLHAPDLVNDPLYKLLERGNDWHGSHLTNSAVGFGFRILLWALFGWQIALASTLAGLFVQQLPFVVNYFCHKKRLGYRNFDGEDDSVNIWWLTFLVMGDNWHNNHHAYPGCARAGMRWYEVDVSFIVIKLLSYVGLVSHINERFNLDAPRGAAVPVPVPVVSESVV